MKRFVSMLFFMVSFILVMISCKSQADSSKTSTPPAITREAATAIPTSSGLTSQADAGAIGDVAIHYYQAIAQQNYNLAYTYLDPTATKLSLTSFIQEARSQDKEEGKLQSYTIAAFPPMVVMTNIRVHLGPYHAHLQFKQEDNAWKIISLDRI